MTTVHIRLCFWIMLVLAWLPTVAVAAGVVISLDDRTHVSLAMILISVLLSSVSGATALVVRIDKELRADPGKDLIRPWLFCAAHMAGSWLAGALAFIMAQAAKWEVWTQLGFIIAASFLGAKFIELAAEHYLKALPVPKSPIDAAAKKEPLP